MAEASPEPVRTFSIGFDHERFDELPHARSVAERFGTEHEEFVVRADAIDGRCPRSCATTASRSPTRRRSRASTSPSMTRRHVTVALNGDGGDESFARLPALRRQRAGRAAGPAFRRRCGAASRPSAAGCPSGDDVSSLRNRVAPAGRHAGARRRRRATRRYVAWLDAAQRARALHARVRRDARRRRACPTDRRRAGPRRPAPTRRRPDARGRRPHLPGRRPDRQGRHRDDGARASRRARRCSTTS